MRKVICSCSNEFETEGTQEDVDNGEIVCSSCMAEIEAENEDLSVSPVLVPFLAAGWKVQPGMDKIEDEDGLLYIERQCSPIADDGPCMLWIGKGWDVRHHRNNDLACSRCFAHAKAVQAQTKAVN